MLIKRGPLLGSASFAAPTPHEGPAVGAAKQMGLTYTGIPPCYAVCYCNSYDVSHFETPCWAKFLVGDEFILNGVTLDVPGVVSGQAQVRRRTQPQEASFLVNSLIL